jgi:hypothetical protein
MGAMTRRLVTFAFALLSVSGAGATTLKQMNLEDLAGRADKIFRGTVLSAKPATVKAGGGELPIVVYRVRVDEEFKGAFGEGTEKGIVEIRMVGGIKEPERAGARHFSLWRDVPRLEKGREYVLFTTRPSRIGLSTTVGLGQGAFSILGAGKKEEAVNAAGNLGLSRGMARSTLRSGPGPVPYAELARAIHAVLGE